MISPQKIRANQQNALRSTGPRSVSGKQRSARNSIRHGLSITGLAPFEEPKVEAIADLLRVEHFGGSEAKAIAEAILVYERNEAHQQEVFTNNYITKANHDPTLVESILGEPIDPSETAEILREAKAELARDRSEEAEDLKDLLHIITMLTRNQIRDDQKSESRRYFKRAANQLAKSIRAAADPTTLE